jgi:hypothetical protein
MNDEQLKALWQSQEVMSNHYSLEQVQSEAAAFRRKILRRNVQESIAAVLVALIFGFYAWVLPLPLMRIGSGLVAFASFFILYQLRHRASSRELPPESLALPYMTYFREELVRQRDVLRHVWTWLIPAALGMGVFFWGLAQPNPADFPWQITSVVIIPFIVVIAMNFFAAHRIQGKINQLDQLNESEKI